MLLFENCRIIRIEGGFQECLERMAKYKQGALDLRKVKEERMVIENRLAAVINGLGRLSREDPRYVVLDREFHELTAQKRSLMVSGRE